MPVTWKTKHGPRRVRHDPPTLAEAIAAAQGLTGDREQQIELAAQLMGVPPAEARAEMARLAPDRRIQLATLAPARDRSGARPVIVERKASRRVALPPARAAGGRQRVG